ncbi:MAG: M3 family metallopeptidase [Alphaproteobacteria bacterium]|nr:M3 family metallopeptidase [Alphaproteobacteria bacterium]
MASPLDDNPSNNPLINPPALPQGAPALDAIKTEHFLPALKEAIAVAKGEIEEIKKNPAAPTFNNTIEAIEFSGHALSRVAAVFSTISGANSNDAIRDMEAEFEVECVKFSNDMMMDAALFTRVKAIHDARATLQLTPEQKMLLEKTYKDFVRSGALLNDADKQQLRDIKEKLSELGTKFENNTVNATKAYKKVIDDEKDLAGVPERARNSYKQAAEEEGLTGKWLIKLSPPPIDIAEYCENRALREEIFRARSGIAYKGQYDNSPVVLEIVKLRQRAAELLGYANHAAFVLDERMAKTPEAVMEFLEKNAKAYRPAAEKFLQQIKDFALQTDGLADLKPWDMALYWRKLQEKTFALDMEELRPYFDLEKVLEGVRIHAEKLFNINLTETSGKYPVYHPDVKVYEVHDKKTGEMIGLFYADYYARPGAKRNGAWESTLRTRGIDGEENKFAFVTNTCNFDKPTKDQPTLLSLDEVRTVFHEFGHGLHDLLAQGNYRSQNGTNVKWDFVELPSQLQENWAKEKEVLDTFAVHYKTGQKLSPELIQKINDMDNFGAGYLGLRQTFMALLDMKWHATDPSKIKSVEELEDGVIAEIWLFPREAGTTSTSFGHIFAGGYAAGYYSYKWAEVLDADVFEEFRSKGLYDRGTAERLRDTIYSRGGTMDPMELYVAMMGREPDPAALFRREGLLPDKKKDNKAPKPPRP